MSGLTSKELKTLIKNKNRTERRCGKFIPPIWEKLILGYRPIKLVDVIEEYRGHLGDCDFVIVAEVSDGTRPCIKAFFWELKAPQCHIFLIDEHNDNRLKPSQDLVDAETQLLYYYYEHRENPSFHRRHKLRGSMDVLLGGIIIGSNDKKIRGEIINNYKEVLYNEALDVRQILYKEVKMRLMTWDEILIMIKSQESPIKVPPTLEVPVERLPVIKENGKLILDLNENNGDSL